MKVLGIIPARKGSKRIPHKNIKSFFGKPIISYAIQTALESKIFDNLIVSTDCPNISKIAKDQGANIPFLRSDENSTDFATTADVVLEAVKYFKEQNTNYDVIVCIYPCTPLITSEILTKAFKTFKSSKAQCLIPLIEYSYPIDKAFKTDSSGRILLPENSLSRTQDREKAYHDAGQFYILDFNSFWEQKKIYLDKFCPFIMDTNTVQDVDNLQDWELLKIKYQLKNKTEHES